MVRWFVRSRPAQPAPSQHQRAKVRIARQLGRARQGHPPPRVTLPQLKGVHDGGQDHANPRVTLEKRAELIRASLLELTIELQKVEDELRRMDAQRSASAPR